MATSTQEEPRSPTAAMAPAEANAKMVVATSRRDCQRLKDLVHQQDATTMLVVTASSNQGSPENSLPPSMHPLLAAVASRGNCEELNFLPNREGPQSQPDGQNAIHAAVLRGPVHCVGSIASSSVEQLAPDAPANAPEVAMDAKMVVATSRGDCQKLKDLVRDQDATTMLVVMASSQRVSHQKADPATMHPLLAAAAYRGNWVEVNFLLNREGPQEHPSWIISEEFRNQVAAYSSGNSTIRSSAMQQATADVEEGINIASLLEGVTVEGNTALHVVAANGDVQDFLDCADLIHDMDRGLLSRQNYKGDTPLHCAARTGNSQMVRHLIGLARRDGIAEELLRQENASKETALHEAVRIGNKGIVELLLEADPRLACFPEEGSSPLYLAILQNDESIAQTLYDKSEGRILSYSGPDGQNALHAAVLRSTGLTRKVLEWNRNKNLTTERDESGSTPLHFAAGVRRVRSVANELWPDRLGRVCSQVFEANTAALYEPDNDGLFPIHVAASAGAKQALGIFVKKCPASAGLRDAKGRTFLHVAVVKKQVPIVRYACSKGSLTWILNMQDNDGDTALHLAVKDGSLRMFSVLFGNRQVNLNLVNAKGQTPLDIAEYMIPPGLLFFSQNSEKKIRLALEIADAMRGASRRDHFQETYEQIHGRKFKAEYEKKQLEDLKDSTQTLCVGSVLIATVTFGANFAMPGGYRADDHTNGGTPTLAGRFPFDGFVMANTLAFISSIIATVVLLRSGTPYDNIRSRKFYTNVAYALVNVSVTFLLEAFALAAYLVLGSVAYLTAIAVCVISLLVVVCKRAGGHIKWAILARPLFIRCPLRSLLISPFFLALEVAAVFWPLYILFLGTLVSEWALGPGLAPAPAPAPAPLN